MNGPGHPKQGFFTDNGGEFINETFSDYVRKMGRTHYVTPAHTPWANGANERGHFTCDQTFRKLREEQPRRSLQSLLDEACYWANQEIRKSGFSAHQIMFGKQAVIPGITDGDITTDSPAQIDEVHDIFNRHHKTKMMYRQVDTDARVKRMLAARERPCNSYRFSPGERVFVKDLKKPIWEETTVHNQLGGNVVTEGRNGHLNSVSIDRVIPKEPIVEKKSMAKEEGIRPKRGAKIQFKLHDEEEQLEGKVTQVGKANGVDRNRAWVRFGNDEIRSFDFSNDVSEWQNINVVHFAEDIIEKEEKTDSAKEMRRKELQMEEKGTQLLFYALRTDVLDDERKVEEVMVAEVPKKYHKSPEVVAAKESEMENFQRFEAYEEVKDVGQPRIGSRWVITQKEGHDGMKTRIKARLVVRGFQEVEDPRSDSPTLANESLKLMLAICANEEFEMQSLDVKNAYLQGREIEREVYVEPPADCKVPGMIWRLKKTVYGTYDGARSFYMSVDDTLTKLGCVKIIGDEALYAWYNEEKKLGGLVGVHVDDFQVAGLKEFEEKVVKVLKQKYVFGKTEKKEFRFTGVDVKQTEEGIEINQAKFCESISQIPVNNKRETERPLDKNEYKLFRGAIGKINWLQGSTRPDLSYDNLALSMKNKSATVADLNKANKVIKKVKDSAEESKVLFPRIDDFENLEIHAYADASYRTQDEKTRSVEGRIIFLTNGKKAAPLLWKSKKIVKVCDSTKSAETLACDKVTDDAIFLARQVRQIYTGEKSIKQIPVRVFTDSKPLYDSLYSTKQVERKSMRHVIQNLKDTLTRGEVESF